VGVTSSDIEDYADERIIRESIFLLQKQYLEFSELLNVQVGKTYDTIIMGRTHLQLAEPTVLGYRLLWYLAQSYKTGILDLDMPTKGMHGAVGTNANLDLMGSTSWSNMLFEIDEPVFQTYPRNRELVIVGVLSNLAAVLHKMAFDIRIMAMEQVLSEVKSSKQIGSSAMPGKNNPIISEKICGLTRIFPSYYQQVWNYSANTLLERTLDDSSSRRVILPEIFLCMSEILDCSKKLMSGLRVVDNKTDSIKKVLNNWKAWLPSRIITVVRANGGIDYEQAYAKIEMLNETCSSGEEFLKCALEAFGIYTGNHRVAHFIHLDKIVEYVAVEQERIRTKISVHNSEWVLAYKLFHKGDK
jgi:adenylosuccinate lyase